MVDGANQNTTTPFLDGDRAAEHRCGHERVSVRSDRLDARRRVARRWREGDRERVSNTGDSGSLDQPKCKLIEQYRDAIVQIWGRRQSAVLQHQGGPIEDQSGCLGAKRTDPWSGPSFRNGGLSARNGRHCWLAARLPRRSSLVLDHATHLVNNPMCLIMRQSNSAHGPDRRHNN